MAQQTLERSIAYDNSFRQYIVYVPSAYDENEPTPLVFNFHGYTGQAFNHMNSTRMRPVADTAGFIVVYPQGALFSGNTHWNVGSWTNGSNTDDLGFTNAMIDTLSAEFNIDLERIYSCGYSNGGYFSFELACQLGSRIAAIGSVGGTMSSETYNDCNPEHPTPVITIHGTADNVVSYYFSNPVGSKPISDVNRYWQNFNNANESPLIENLPNLNSFDGSTVKYFTFQEGDNCVTVDHYQVNGGGHDWPGAWGNKDIDASVLIWNFFSKYDINGLIGCETNKTNQSIIETDEVGIYPNPGSDYIEIEIYQASEIDYYIYAQDGSLQLRGKTSPNANVIDISILPPNMYFLKVDNKVVKFIKI